MNPKVVILSRDAGKLVQRTAALRDRQATLRALALDDEAPVATACGITSLARAAGSARL